MNPRHYSLGAGILFLALGILGFIPGFVTESLVLDPEVGVDAFSGRLFGLFPVNAVLNIFWIILGISGISAYSSRGRDLPASINYSRVTFAILGALSLLGMFEATATFFGFAPLYGNNIWLHGIGSLVGAYYGWALSSQVKEHTAPDRPRGFTTSRLGDQV